MFVAPHFSYRMPQSFDTDLGQVADGDKLDQYQKPDTAE